MDEKSQSQLPPFPFPQPTGSPIPRMSLSPAPSSSQSTPRDFVARVLGPRIAVVASPDANEVCQANNLPSLADLIKPFGNMIDGKGKPLSIPFQRFHFQPFEGFDERHCGVWTKLQPSPKTPLFRTQNDSADCIGRTNLFPMETSVINLKLFLA